VKAKSSPGDIQNNPAVLRVEIDIDDAVNSRPFGLAAFRPCNVQHDQEPQFEYQESELGVNSTKVMEPSVFSAKVSSEPDIRLAFCDSRKTLQSVDVSRDVNHDGVRSPDAGAQTDAVGKLEELEDKPENPQWITLDDLGERYPSPEKRVTRASRTVRTSGNARQVDQSMQHHPVH
jgi:hypothetical protein